MDDLISRAEAIDALDVLCQEHRYKIPGKGETYSQYNEAWQDALDRAEGAIFNLPPAQPERKKGEWIEREVTYIDDLEAKDIITAWQSCKCSVCGRYDTRPYMYYFNVPKYCSWCGAEMEVSK